MSRFVIASFLFLGWGFYEASGGADFEPPKGPSAAVNIAKAAFGSDSSPSTASIRSTEVTAESLISKVALRVPQSDTTQAANTKPARPAADPALRSRVAMEQIAAVGAGLSNSDTAFSATTTSQASFQTSPATSGAVQLASLTDGLSTQPLVQAALESEPQDIVEPAADIRSITATRVNMRSGPGTVYPIVDRLSNGEEVAVFEDIGTGWLHLRTVKDGKVGWIAASLVSQKRP
ncbi:SH3 domain-containing protein [Phaeobacter gallaeciensis]|uniref:Bacterial SH3 domain protein n=1 Tax=Phaeobacter gallaeciensis TaxID=60890 RepID=A0AAC9Z6B5_9RHOB|nr:SH3 domain-containing protein [Phaeobacter gallaeciensis]AHD08063.1 Bacterial SH3 domain protein [Phaeobacter gallaeciensis DSM 26640]ATE91329.1 Bacterial SH3 domain protein [Phaeobacter gallaeciensis]ATE95605.1 Bacterial SH3 domain protein [Phaeobacter gallaeciensis]ATE99944.1 Bacterial SH3 domain protein [Phaeobacter gallaeciensis]ATF04377.1 Bacterial SH3 domain protein [Phaeobacter gallaeciensis]